MKKYFYLIGALVGFLAGYIYWYYYGCTESCAITSSWEKSSVYGAVCGILIASWFIPDRKKIHQNEKEN